MAEPDRIQIDDLPELNIQPPSRRRKSNPEPKAKRFAFKCDFCKGTFQTERTFMAHSCEKKRRYINKDEPESRLALRAFQLYWKATVRSKNDKTFEEFIDSQYYIAFIKFGKFLINISAIKPEKYLEYLIKSETPIDKWTTEEMYGLYIRDFMRKEDPYDATMRSIEMMEQWAAVHNSDWTRFFDEVTTPYAVALILRGLISPWAIYAAGTSMIRRMSEEQLVMIKPFIEPLFWRPQLKKNSVDFINIEKLLQSSIGA